MLVLVVVVVVVVVAVTYCWGCLGGLLDGNNVLPLTFHSIHNLPSFCLNLRDVDSIAVRDLEPGHVKTLTAFPKRLLMRKVICHSDLECAAPLERTLVIAVCPQYQPVDGSVYLHLEHASCLALSRRSRASTSAPLVFDVPQRCRTRAEP